MNSIQSGFFGSTGDDGLTWGNSQPVHNFSDDATNGLRANTETPFVLSYADTTQGHHGGIYQACGFVYVGATDARFIGFNAPDGSFVHGRICNGRFGTQSIPAIKKIKPDWVPVYAEPKHLYIFPLRQKWATIAHQRKWQSLPYPKPSAARLLDASVPTGASKARILGAASNSLEAA